MKNMGTSGTYKAPHNAALSPSEWVLLKPNDRLWVRRENHSDARGTVDVIAPDSSIFWMWLDSGRGRVAFHKDDNDSIFFDEDHTPLGPANT